MTIQEFRSDKNKVRTANAMLQSPALQEMLAVLEVSNPLRSAIQCMTPHEHNDSRLLGIAQGYHMALDYLRSMGTPQPELKEVPQNYPER